MSDVKSLAIVPSENELAAINNIAISAVQSGLFGRDMTQSKAFIIMLKGRDLGIPILQAISQIHIIEGKPCMSAELMHSQVLKYLPNASIHFAEVSNTACKIEAKRSKNDPTSTFIFTIADAKAAGLLNKPNWQKYPRAMLRSRCISEVCRSIFPDALHGVSYTPEEMGTDGNEEIKNVTPNVPQNRFEQNEDTKTPKPKEKQVDKSAPAIVKASLSQPQEVEKVMTQAENVLEAQKKAVWKIMQEFNIPRENAHYCLSECIRQGGWKDRKKLIDQIIRASSDINQHRAVEEEAKQVQATIGKVFDLTVEASFEDTH